MSNFFKKITIDVWRMFTHKNGQFSKTAFMLSAAGFVALAQWLVLGFLAGLEVHGFELPSFDATANVLMMAAFSATYVANHKIRASRDSDGGVVIETPGEEEE